MNRRTPPSETPHAPPRRYLNAIGCLLPVCISSLYMILSWWSAHLAEVADLVVQARYLSPCLSLAIHSLFIDLVVQARARACYTRLEPSHERAPRTLTRP